MTQLDTIKGQLQKHYSECVARSVSIPKGAATLPCNESDANTRKMLHSTMNVLKDQMDINMLLIQFINLTNSKTNNEAFDSIDKFFGGSFK